MIRIRKQEKHQKLEWLSPLGMSVVRLHAPAVGAVSKTVKRLQSLHRLGHMYRITTVKACHLDFISFTKGSHLSSVRPLVLLLQPAVSGCVILVK